ncbi:MAG: hypothetical protein IT442_16755 [Phycisphaeraceae bacterium]|nr:hypothetical protein [Phycisphaeraceae bacterium]
MPTRVWFTSWGRQSLSLLVVAALWAGSAWADKLILKDGTQQEGRLVSRDDQLVVFEVQIGKIKIERQFPAQDVERIETDAPEATQAVDAAGNPAPESDDSTTVVQQDVPSGPAPAPATGRGGYFLVPLEGDFGTEITGEIFQRCLDKAAELKPSAVVVTIKSPGGMVSTLMDMLDASMTWQSQQTIPLVVLVKDEAFSAAAIFALSAKQLYVMPGSAIGAALVVHLDRGQMTDLAGSGAVGEKFASAFRAKARTALEQAGRDPLISEAMIDPDVELYLARDSQGRPRLVRGPLTLSEQRSDRFTRAPTMVVERGKLLTLTSNEAIALGAAQGVAADVDELGRLMGLEGWTAINDFGVRTTAARVALVAEVRDKYAKSAEGITQGLSLYLQSTSGEINQIERSVLSVRSRLMRIERLVEENDWLAPQAQRDFPGGLTSLRLECDQFLGRIRETKQQQRQQIQQR